MVQNPALGSVLLARFAAGYQEAASQVAPPLLAGFLVLPLVFHKRTLDTINSTLPASGLALFAAKLASEKEELLAVHTRALAWRALTLKSLGIASSTGLILINYEDASYRALDCRIPVLPERVRQMPKAAEKLGIWLAQVTLPQAAAVLKVAL